MTSRTPFPELLARRWIDGDTLLCVGLDPDRNQLPPALAGRSDALFRFCADVVDATADLVCAFKPQIAYFAAQRAEDQLERLIAYIHQCHPQVPVLLDAKRGDIGSTARLYAREVFERYDADAVTVNPYLGRESLEPYLDYADRGVFLLCRTSNPESGWLQEYPAERPIYLRVAEAAMEWNRHGNLMLVVGATQPAQLERVRRVVGEMPLLVPGIGAQGGDLGAVLAAGLDRHGHGLLINSSRSILYAGSGDGFADAARAAASALASEIRRVRDGARVSGVASHRAG
ncbi:MAG TPA: orotidine-5'-phosphate decarboxylase [Pseudomonadales bacterium]